MFEIPDDYQPTHVQAAALRLRQDATYVVTGAQSRLGLEISRWLSDNGATDVAMVSSHDKLTSFARATKQYMESRSTNVYDIQNTLTTADDVRSIFKELQFRGANPIKGIFNLDSYEPDLSNQDPEYISELLNRQLRSAQLMDSGSVSLDLDHFVVFTSVDAIRGTETLPSRAAVGAVLGDMCATRRASGICGLCLQFGQIRGVGASGSDNKELTDEADTAGNKSLHFHEYLTILGNLLHKDDLPATVAVTNQVCLTISFSCQLHVFDQHGL